MIRSVAALRSRLGVYGTRRTPSSAQRLSSGGKWLFQDGLVRARHEGRALRRMVQLIGQCANVTVPRSLPCRPLTTEWAFQYSLRHQLTAAEEGANGEPMCHSDCPTATMRRARNVGVKTPARKPFAMS